MNKIPVVDAFISPYLNTYSVKLICETKEDCETLCKSIEKHNVVFSIRAPHELTIKIKIDGYNGNVFPVVSKEKVINDIQLINSGLVTVLCTTYKEITFLDGCASIVKLISEVEKH